MRRTPHFHLLDSADGDWSAHLELSEAKAAIHRAVADSQEFYNEPMREEEFNIVASGNWCADQEPPCYFDRDQAMLRHLRETAEWSPTFDDDHPPPIYRIDGRRVARWRLACAMTTDEAQTLWPTAGHPVALHTWRHDLIMADSRLCACTTRQHRKKGCPIGPNGRGCQMCGALYEDYGNVQSCCRACEHWREQREIYLATWAAQRLQGASTARRSSWRWPEDNPRKRRTGTCTHALSSLHLSGCRAAHPAPTSWTARPTRRWTSPWTQSNGLVNTTGRRAWP